MEITKEETMKEMLEIIGDLGHASAIITRAAKIETALSEILEFRLPKLSATLKDKLFTGYGPLSSLSAKIDILFAMGALTEALRRDLHVLRELRNEFAHTSSHSTFKSKGVLAIFAKFPDLRVN